MKSRTTRRFRDLFQALPHEAKEQARAAYRLFEQDPHHRSLQLKEINPKTSLWSVRVGLHWRALGWREHDLILWFWIGSHADYDGLISRY
jgi:hypothetical protein